MHTNINLEFADFDEHKLKSIITLDTVVDIDGEDYAEFKTDVTFVLYYNSECDIDALIMVHKDRVVDVLSAINDMEILERKLVRYLISL